MTEQFVGKFGEGHRLAIIAICNLDVIQNKAYATHLQFAYRLAKDNPEFQFFLFVPYRMSIANFRNMAAQSALASNAEYLMFIDDDAVLLTHENLSLFKYLKDKIDNDENKHVIMPIVYVRGYPFNPMFFKWEDNPELIKEGKGVTFYTDWEKELVDENGLLEVAAVGCHTCLIKTEVLKSMPEPFFLTGTYNTEDVYFCMKCRDYIENIGIYVDTTVCSSHLLDPLYVNQNNVEILKEFYEKLGHGSSDFEFSQQNLIKDQLNELGEEFEA